MSDREDKKLQQVPVATYTYRHEAEFAAGFLTSAGIPYRLQIEDPTLGLSASESATLWVHAMDERRAREVLDQELALEDGAVEELQDGAVKELEDGAAEELEVRAAGVDGAGIGARHEAPVTAAGRRPGASEAGPGMDMQANMKTDLTLRQRVVALIGGAGVGSLMGIEAVRDAHWVVSWAVVVVAVALVLAGVLGRAPGPLRSLLSSFSGDIP